MHPQKIGGSNIVSTDNADSDDVDEWNRSVRSLGKVWGG
jgi:hypothetical protein